MSIDTLNTLMLGGIAVGSFVAGLFFLRYWLSSGDRFFLYFMLSFWIEAGNRVDMGLSDRLDEVTPVHYSVRLLAYALILLAIWDKNRPGRK